MSHMGKCLLVDQPFALATHCTASFNSIPPPLLTTQQVDALRAGTDSPRFAQGLERGLVPKAIRTETTGK